MAATLKARVIDLAAGDSALAGRALAQVRKLRENGANDHQIAMAIGLNGIAAGPDRLRTEVEALEKIKPTVEEIRTLERIFEQLNFGNANRWIYGSLSVSEMCGMIRMRNEEFVLALLQFHLKIQEHTTAFVAYITNPTVLMKYANFKVAGFRNYLDSIRSALRLEAGEEIPLEREVVIEELGKYIDMEKGQWMEEAKRHMISTSAVFFREVRSTLEKLAGYLYHIPIVAKVSESSTPHAKERDETGIFLPDHMDHFNTRDKNHDMYLQTTAHEAGHLYRGSFKVNVFLLAEFLEERGVIIEKIEFSDEEKLKVKNMRVRVEKDGESKQYVCTSFMELFQFVDGGQPALQGIWNVLEDLKDDCTYTGDAIAPGYRKNYVIETAEWFGVEHPKDTKARILGLAEYKESEEKVELSIEQKIDVAINDTLAFNIHAETLEQSALLILQIKDSTPPDIEELIGKLKKELLEEKLSPEILAAADKVITEDRWDVKTGTTTEDVFEILTVLLKKLDRCKDRVKIFRAIVKRDYSSLEGNERRLAEQFDPMDQTVRERIGAYEWKILRGYNPRQEEFSGWEENPGYKIGINGEKEVNSVTNSLLVVTSALVGTKRRSELFDCMMDGTTKDWMDEYERKFVRTCLAINDEVKAVIRKYKEQILQVAVDPANHCTKTIEVSIRMHEDLRRVWVVYPAQTKGQDTGRGPFSLTDLDPSKIEITADPSEGLDLGMLPEEFRKKIEQRIEELMKNADEQTKKTMAKNAPPGKEDKKGKVIPVAVKGDWRTVSLPEIREGIEISDAVTVTNDQSQESDPATTPQLIAKVTSRFSILSTPLVETRTGALHGPQDPVARTQWEIARKRGMVLPPDFHEETDVVKLRKITLLVLADASGSTAQALNGGRKIDYIRMAAESIVAGAKEAGIRAAGGYVHSISADNVIYVPGTDFDGPMRYVEIEPKYSNRDGAFIRLAGRILEPEKRYSQILVPIFISDAMPACENYSGNIAIADVQDAIRRLLLQRMDPHFLVVPPDEGFWKGSFSTMEDYLLALYGRGRSRIASNEKEYLDALTRIVQITLMKARYIETE